MKRRCMEIYQLQITIFYIRINVQIPKQIKQHSWLLGMQVTYQ